MSKLILDHHSAQTLHPADHIQKPPQISKNINTLAGSFMKQVQSLVTHETSIQDMLLDGTIESIVGVALKGWIEYSLYILGNKDTQISERIRELERMLKDLDNQYHTETDNIKKQGILQIVRAYNQDLGVQKIQRYKQRRDAVLEKAFQKSAEMFHIGEDILKQNPDITGAQLAEQIEARFITQNIKLSKDHKKILSLVSILLEEAKQERQRQLEEIFQKAQISMPANLKDIENIMNTHPTIQFQEWKNYSVKRGGTDYIDRILARNEDTTIKTMEKTGVHGSMQHLTQAQKEVIAWQLEGGVKVIQFNLTSHPTCIIYQFKETSSYINSSLGHIALGTGKIYIRGDQTPQEIQNTIEHEYQHFLHLTFVEPIETQLFHKSLDGDLDEYTRFRKRFGERDNTYHLKEQWRSMKDEIASYLERNGTLAPNFDGYLSKNQQGQTLIELYGYNIDYVELFDRILHELIKHGASNKDIVDIVRTSAGFEHAYKRFREKYQSVIEFPINMNHWKLKGIDDMIVRLDRYSEAIGYDDVHLKKSEGTIVAEYHVLVQSLPLLFLLETKASDSTAIKIFLENLYNKINLSLPAGGIPDKDDVKEFLSVLIKNFGTAHIGDLGYIDQDLVLHSQTWGNLSLFDDSHESKQILGMFFPYIKNDS